MEPPDLQNLQVQALKELVPKFGFESTDIACRSYTMGNVSYRMLQNDGGFSVTSLCTESHIDGSMGINHWGKPERPYFMSSDDFRKPGPGGPNGTVAFSQVQRHTYLARQYSCDFNIEPGNGGYPEAGGREEFDSVYFSRILDFYHGLLEMPRCQDGPFFIQQAIEFNGERPQATDGNRLILEYAAQKAATGNVVFATTRGVADFYKRHYNETPESTFYFQDYWAGVVKALKPVNLEDSMSLENARIYALALRGQILPEVLYDYTSKWDFPDFGNEEMPRRPGDPSAYLRPGTFDKFAATPRIVDTRKFKVERADAESGKSLAITVSVEAAEAHSGLALALWDIPREFQRGTDWFNASSGARFVPVLAPYTDNLNGFLIVNVKPGANRFTLQINSPARTLQSQDVKIGDSLEGKVFTRDGTTMAYVWSSLPWSSSLVLTLPEGKSATVYVAPQGIRQECRAGANRFDIPQGQWLRVTGLTREELRESAEQGKPDSH